MTQKKDSRTSGGSGSGSLLIRISRDKQRQTDGQSSSRDSARVERFSFQDLCQSDGEPVKDLNDLLKISTDSYRRSAQVVLKPCYAKCQSSIRATLISTHTRGRKMVFFSFIKFPVGR